MMGQGMRRRMGAPSSTLGMAEPTQTGTQAETPHGFAAAGAGNALDALVGHYSSNGGWLDSRRLQTAMKSVDREHGPGTAKQAHKDLVTHGVVSKQRARSTHYSMNG